MGFSGAGFHPTNLAFECPPSFKIQKVAIWFASQADRIMLERRSEMAG
jgi:hypothetical protein